MARLLIPEVFEKFESLTKKEEKVKKEKLEKEKLKRINYYLELHLIRTY